MANNKATIKASLEGVEGVVSGANKIKGALASAGDGGKALGAAAKTAGDALLNMTSTALRASGLIRDIDLGAAIEGARKLDNVTTRLGQQGGKSAEKLAASFEALSQTTMTSAPTLAQYALGLTKTTYDANSSAEALKGLGTEALATGRDLADNLNLGQTMRNSLSVIGDTTQELGRLRSIAESVGLAGGRLQLQDSLAQLSPLLATVSTKTDESRAKLESLVAVMGKGMKPGAATQVAASALSMIKTRALDIERNTGKRVLDEYGEIIDPTQTLASLKEHADKKFGKKNSDAKRRAMMSEYGMDLGLAIMRTDYNEVNKLSASSTKNAPAAAARTQAEADAYRSTAAGRHDDDNNKVDGILQKAGKAVNNVVDSINKELGAEGSLVANAAGQSTNALVRSALGDTMPAKLAGGAAGLLVGGLSGLGYVAGKGLADKEIFAGPPQLYGRGSVEQGSMPVSIAAMIGNLSAPGGSSGGSNEAIAAGLASLAETQEKLPKAMADAMTAGLRQTKLVVQPPIDPNALKVGN